MRYSRHRAAAAVAKRPESKRKNPSIATFNRSLNATSCSSRFVSDAPRENSGFWYASNRPSDRHSSVKPAVDRRSARAICFYLECVMSATTGRDATGRDGRRSGGVGASRARARPRSFEGRGSGSGVPRDVERASARENGLSPGAASPSRRARHPRDVSAGVKRRRRERLARRRAWGRTLHAHGVYRRQVYVSRLTNVVQQRRLALELLLSRNRRGDSLQLRGERRHGGRLARSESLEALSAVRSRGACLDPTPSRGRSVPATVVHRCDACRWNARLACGTASRRTDPHVATAPCPEFAAVFFPHSDKCAQC